MDISATVMQEEGEEILTTSEGHPITYLPLAEIESEVEDDDLLQWLVEYDPDSQIVLNLRWGDGQSLSYRIGQGSAPDN